jgi:CHAT domain-containing protein/tetratricopeptide (TPR) repeat protein
MIKNTLLITFFLSNFIAYPTFAQNLPKIYNELESLYNIGDFEACIKLEKKVELFAFSRKDTFATNSYYYLGDAYNQLGDFEKAIPLWEKLKDLLKELNIPDQYSMTLYNLADIYQRNGDYAKAGITADQLIVADKKLFEPSSDEYVSTVISVADIYFRLDRLKEEQALLQSTRKQQVKNSINEGLLLNKLGDLHTYKGEYTKASQALMQSILIFRSNLNESSIQYLSATANLGILYKEQGRYPEAEEQFDEVLKKADPVDAANIYFPTLNNLAQVYQNLGQLEKAEKTFLQIKKQDSIDLGIDHPFYAVTLSNLSGVYHDEGKYEYAEKSLLAALEIQKARNETTSVSYARKLNNLAKVYMFSGKPDEALKLYEQANLIYKKGLGENNAEYATNIFNIGMTLWKIGKPDEGYKYLKNSSSIRAAVLGKKHPKYAESQQKIAEYLWFKQSKKEARQTYGEVFDNYYNQIESVFPALIEEEKAKFYYNTIRPSFEKFNSFALAYAGEDPTIMSEVYNHQINTKGVIMLATEKVKEAIQSSRDTTLVKKFENWQAVKEQIAKLYSHSQSSSQLDSLLSLADASEKELSKQSAEFARQFIRKKYFWGDVQKTLKSGEAAIEVVRYQKFSPDSAGKFLDDISYGFLIVTPKTINHPDYIMLKGGKDIEGKFLNFYKNSILFNQEDNYTYRNFFEPLGDYLKKNKIDNIYFSPDGVFNQISMNTIRNPFNNKYLVDEYVIQMVTNTRELLERRPKTTGAKSSVLVGFPTFNLDAKQVTQPKATNRSISRGGSNRGLRGGLLRYVDPENGISVLPGTEKEIEKISELLTVSASPVVFTQALASEGVAKRINSPTILHVATHGYFLEDDEKNRETSGYVFNPLLKSGLIFAGAENFIRSGTAVDTVGNDGILTAYEAMNLNLETTELVVLSACETGLGVIKNGEGVYGLQRAFKLSGAKSVIMSLWSVDDEATQALMTLFYTEFMKTGNAQSSLRMAQRKLKTKYPQPFYWGAFVLVGI